MISFCFDFYNFYSVFSKLLSPAVQEQSRLLAESVWTVWSLCQSVQDFFLSSIKKMNLRFTKNSIRRIYLKKYLELIIAGKFWFWKMLLSCRSVWLKSSWKLNQDSWIFVLEGSYEMQHHDLWVLRRYSFNVGTLKYLINEYMYSLNYFGLNG